MKPLKHFSILIICLVILSCTKDFIVKDIKNEVVSILAPGNNLVTSSNSITFWWEELEGAENYNIQIVKPSFASVLQLIVDTNITGDKFNYTLNPGVYQWRIKAKNAGGSTAYTTYNLTIDTTSNLSNQLVSTIAPINNLLTSNTSVSFSWNNLSAASQYQIQILNSVSTIIKDTTTTNSNYFWSNTSGGAFTWKVRALNGFSISQYNTPLSFTIDITPPIASVLSSPTHGSFVKDTIDLKWTRSTMDTKYDSLYVSIDSSFNSIISSARVYSTKLKINALSPNIPVSANYYWWRVRSIDSVGNKSGFSNQLKFKLIP
ncbi:MAG: hypothetical protein JNK50_01050 [Bacteroidia bacterium]|nr:hypothetical protein [Bacteroidia bacterium]